jgi:hypothetical protein
MIADKMIAENEGGGCGRMNEVNIEPAVFAEQEAPSRVYFAR